MTAGTERRLERLRAPQTIGSPLTAAAAVVAAVTIVLYQTWFMPYFQSFFAGRESFARLVFYSLYGSLGLAALGLCVRRSEIRRTVAPLAVVGALAVAGTALHPLGLVTRAYIIAVAIAGSAIVLLLASAPVMLLRLAAAVTALNAGLCFVDLLFADGFTNTLGRAAGLAINPNGAAASILLGAAASHRAVPARFYPSFLVLIAGALATTLSRSTMLVALVAAGTPMAIVAWQRVRARRPLWQVPDGAGSAAFVAGLLAIWVGIGAMTNSRLVPVAQAAVYDSLAFTGALNQAHGAVAREVSAPAPPPAAASPAARPATSAAVVTAPPRPAPVPAARPAPVPAPAAPAPARGAKPALVPAAPVAVPRARPAAAPGTPEAKRVEALTARLSDEGLRNSTSARTLFLERALLAYRNNGFFGMGLEAAHPLVPHNTFVLFALAFGHLGWLIPIALVAGAVYLARDARDLPIAIAAAGTMATSHDILLTPSLLLPLALGIGGMLAARPDTAAPESGLLRPVAAGAIAACALFAAGCAAILLWTPSFSVERLAPSGMQPYRGAYLSYIPASTFPGLFVPLAGSVGDDHGAYLRDGSGTLTRVRFAASARPLVAAGEFAVADGQVFFMPSDGRDPRLGGPTMELGLPHAVGLPFYALLGALALWCAGLGAWLRQAHETTTAAAQPVAVG